MRKLAPALVSYQDDVLISYRVNMMMGHFISQRFEGTLHVDKIHLQFKIASITHALPFLAHLKTDFTPKRVKVSRLRDTGAKFRTGVKFSLRYKTGVNSRRGDSRFVVLSCNIHGPLYGRFYGL